MMNKRISTKHIIFLAFFVINIVPTLSFAKRAIPSNNLAYPVLINILGKNPSTATAFYLRNDKYLYLVTAKHVLFTEPPESRLRGTKAICLSYPEDISVKNPILIMIDVNSCNDRNLIKYHQKHDAAIIQIGLIVKKSDDSSFSIEFNKGVTQPKGKISPNIVVAYVENIKSFKDVLISNDIFIFGYPISIGIKKSPQFEYQRPLLRKGIIAGKNIKKETIIIDCPAYYGNSGGPVIEVDRISLTESRYLLIGILSQFIPYTETWENKSNRLTHLELTNSGYSVVTPIDKVLELISQYEERKKQN